MTSKEKLLNKMAATQGAKTEAVNLKVSEAELKKMFYGQGKTDLTEQFDKQVINLNDVLKEKLQFLCAGKPLIIENEDEGSKDFVDEIELQEIYFQLIGVLYDKFNAFVTIKKFKNGKVKLQVADPNFPNVVRRRYGVPYESETWEAFETGRAQYWLKETYSTTKITRELYTEENGDFDSKENVEIKKFNKENKGIFEIVSSEKNKSGIIPVVHIQWLPSFDKSVGDANNKSLSSRIKPFQDYIDEAFKRLQWERFLNRTKTLTDQDMLDEEKAAEIVNENIIAVLKDSGAHDGNNKVFELLQGDPKLEAYWADITNAIQLAIKSLKLSDLGENENGSGSATEAIFNKGNDVETGNVISVFHQRWLSKILAKAWVMTDKSKVKPKDETDLNTKDWNVQIIPNVIVNEAKMTEIVIAQLGAGLINMVQAKVKLEGISQKDAEELLSTEEQFYNPALDASSGFNEDEDEEPGEDKEISKNNGDDVVDKK